MLKILLGVGLGFLLFTNQEAMQITADLLRATGDAIAPAVQDRTGRSKPELTKSWWANRGTTPPLTC